MLASLTKRVVEDHAATAHLNVSEFETMGYPCPPPPHSKARMAFGVAKLTPVDTACASKYRKRQTNDVAQMDTTT